jgi:hypothetical protein
MGSVPFWRWLVLSVGSGCLWGVAFAIDWFLVYFFCVALTLNLALWAIGWLPFRMVFGGGSESFIRAWGKSGTPESNQRRREAIPKHVKRSVWQRDQGRCTECGSKEKLEYDHIIPWSNGSS